MSIKLGELMKVWRIEEDYESIEIHGFNDDWYGTVKELKIGVLNWKELEVYDAYGTMDNSLTIHVNSEIKYKSHAEIKDDFLNVFGTNEFKSLEQFINFLDNELYDVIYTEKVENGYRVFDTSSVKSITLTYSWFEIIKEQKHFTARMWDTDWQIGEKVTYFYDNGITSYHPAWILCKSKYSDKVYKIICPILSDEPIEADISCIEPSGRL